MRNRERTAWGILAALLLLAPAAARHHRPKALALPSATGDLTLTLPLSASGQMADGRTVSVAGSLVVTIPALPMPPLMTLTAASPTVLRGNSLSVSWKGLTNPTTTDWIGIFTPGAVGSDATILDWGWTTGQASGTIMLPINAVRAPGVYELRLYRHDTYTLAITGPAVTVTAPPAAGPHLSFSPASLDWGTYYLSKTHHFEDRMVSLTNDGGGVLTGKMGTVQAADVSFTVGAGSSFSLRNGQIQILGLRFAPTTAGVKSGSLSISSNDPRGTVAIPITATAAPLPKPVAGPRP